MIHIFSIPLMLMTAVSIWGILLFAFQNAFFRIDSIDRRFFLVSSLLIFIFIGNLYYLVNFIRNVKIYQSVLDFVNLGMLAISVLYIYLLDHTNLNLNKNSALVRIVIYLVAFAGAVAIRMYTRIEFAIDVAYAAFLAGEILYLTLNAKKDAPLKEIVLLCATYSIMIALNVTDIFLKKYSFNYGVWILPPFFVFYAILKYREYRESLRDQIVLLQSVEKKEKESYFTSINMIVHLLESKNEYLKGHSEKVSFYATLLGMRAGLTHDECEDLSVAALLHDIGYVGVSMDVYMHTNMINHDDIQKIRYHPIIGAEILRKSSLFSKYADIILYHHENWNGSGYPYGLAGEQIPFYSRIIQIADTYDSLTTNRFYRTALNKNDALLIIRSGKGQDFDPILSEMFIDCMK